MSPIILGKPLNWEETQNLTSVVKKIGIQQFVSLFLKHSARDGDALTWGDEIEYTLVRFNHQSQRAQLALRATEILDAVTTVNDLKDSIWTPECCEYMLEGLPGDPYGESLCDLVSVEHNMRARRKKITALLKSDEMLLTIAKFPRLGCDGFTWPEFSTNPESNVFRSRVFPDEALYRSGHQRYPVVIGNALRRRGSKLDVQIPLFKDKKTVGVSPDVPEQQADMIYLDGLGFGISGLQMTFQTRNMEDARRLYDNLAPLCPILNALTAATPFYRGYISDVDSRWQFLISGLDCRTREERIKIKPRLGSISCYISTANAEYNDAPITYHEEHFRMLVENGVDRVLAQHVAHQFLRDPLILFEGSIYQDPDKESGHFDNINTSHWMTLRFKPPPVNGPSSLGWRVEFRPCEVQLTDFENAAFACFVFLLTRIILADDGLELAIPISKVDENFENSHRRNAVIAHQFWYRDNMNNNSGYSLKTIDEIINGNGNEKWFGLIPQIRRYLDSMDLSAETRTTLESYLSLISQRASGDLMTPAKWFRDFVSTHPDYKHDSVISEKINYDLLKRIGKLDSEPCPKLL